MTKPKVALSTRAAAWIKIGPVQANVSPSNPINISALAVKQAEVDQMVADVRSKFPGLEESDLPAGVLEFIRHKYRLMPGPNVDRG